MEYVLQEWGGGWNGRSRGRADTPVSCPDTRGAFEPSRVPTSQLGCALLLKMALTNILKRNNFQLLEMLHLQMQSSGLHSLQPLSQQPTANGWRRDRKPSSLALSRRNRLRNNYTPERPPGTGLRQRHSPSHPSPCLASSLSLPFPGSLALLGALP